MRRFFLENFDYEGTGSVVAATGEIPALEQFHVKGGYKYEWVRDSALCVDALLKLAGSRIGSIGGQSPITQTHTEHLAALYLQRVKGMMEWKPEAHGWGDGEKVEALVQPRWGIYDMNPYSENWCEPQTDGPGLRAQALLQIAWRTTSKADRDLAWQLAKQDLDWLSAPFGANAFLKSCDLWEEDLQDGELLWNRISGRLALQLGLRYAASMGDLDRVARYNSTLTEHFTNIFGRHVKQGDYGDYISECTHGTSRCTERGGDIDGAVILSFIHSGWMDIVQDDTVSPTSAEVARTVQSFNEEYCFKFPVNLDDTQKGVPGVLYGRYANDKYGGGNPWVLITASLASLFYQGARSISLGSPVLPAALEAWRDALWWDFGGTAGEFVAAGDAVLTRLKAHIGDDEGWHLWEQLDRHTGKQFNAKDITWSYAEVLSALVQRDEAMTQMSIGVHWL